MSLSGNPEEKLNKQLLKSYESLNEYIDVPGLIELREFLENLRDDECFKFIAENISYDLNDEGIEYKSKCNPFKQAYKTLGEFKFLIKLSNVPYASFIGLYSIIAYSCAYKYGRDLTKAEKADVLKSNLHSKISLGLDNFKEIENSEDFNKNFFKKLSSIKWDKRSNKLHSQIHYAYIQPFASFYNMKLDVSAQFILSSRYLASCICLSKGKDEVSPEDIVSAWNLTFKLLHTNLHPYVFKDEDDKCINGNNNVSISKGKKFSKGVAIFLSIIFFIFLSLIACFILILLFDNNVYNVGRLPGLIILFICGYLTKLFYSKILDK